MSSILTPKQAECLAFLKSYVGDNRGVSPTTREIAAALALSSSSRVRPLLDVLEERGLIRRLSNRARSIEVVSAPQPWFANMSTDAFAGLFESIAEEIANRAENRA